MSGIVGTANLRAEVALTFNGQTDWFPLPENAEEQEFGAGDIQTSTLESFSPSVVAGDPTVISNDILAALTWSNFQDGMGTLQYAPQEGTGSLDSFRSGSLDTRFPNMAVLPPGRVSLGTLALSFGSPPATPVYFAATGNATYPLICYASAGVVGQQSIQRMNASNSWTAITFPGGGGAGVGDSVSAYVQYNGLHVFATTRGIFYSGDLVSFAQGWNPGTYCIGLCIHDNKLYTFASGKMYWTLDPTGTAAWPFSSTDTLRLAPYESVNALVEWKNRQSSRSLFVLTSRRIVAYDDDDYWAEFFQYGRYIDGTGADLTVWLQDKGMYMTPGDSGANVLAFQNQTISNISPAKRGGLQGAENFAIVRLQGGLNWLFAQTAPPAAVGGVGITATSTGATYPAYQTRGDILAYNGRGWHTVVRGVSTADNPTAPGALTGMTYVKNQLIFLREGQYVETVYVPDSAVPPVYNNGPITYRTGFTCEIVGGRTDAALKAIPKTGRYWEVQIEQPDGTPGLPAGCTARLSWTHDGQTTIFPTMDSSTVFPARFACDSVTDAGVAWRVMNGWKLELTNASGAATTTPVLRSVTHYYLRSPNLIDGYQFRLDLSERRFRGDVGGTWRGKSRLYLYNRLMQIKKATTSLAIQFGTEGDPVVIPAAEIRVAGQLNGGTGAGLFTVTARDVSTPANG